MSSEAGDSGAAAGLQLSRPELLLTRTCIGGQWQGAASGASVPVLDPASGATVTTVPDMGLEDARSAIDAAHGALGAWGGLLAKERAALLHALYEAMMVNQEDLARIITAECGKPITEARGEIAYGASFFQWFAEEAKRVYGDVIPATAPGRRNVILKQPVGVCAAITPWNFPNAMIARKVAPALAAGCTIVVKPAEDTPLSALALAALAEEVGIPAGVINVVTSSRENGYVVGKEFCTSHTVRKVSFTGSTPVGRILMEQSASTIKKISLELGGNAPFIVFDDADVDAAVVGATASKFRNTGQTCVSANRFLVQAGVYDEFARKLAAAVSSMKVGAGKEGADQGPLINAAGMEKVSSHVDDAVAKGATVMTGGQPHALGGNFFEPTVLTGATTEMAVAREETFGPVAALMKFETEEEAVTLANDTEFGLASYFYTRDLARTWRVSEALEYGMVGINDGIISTEVAPFGGCKSSGLGREGSKYGIDDYLEVKYLCMGGL
jgi:succinate-semialdehyde dehydrogenase/glutarate-semialdehyde dehydrogenase